MFLIGKKNKLLTALGIVYGHIYIEGLEPLSVVDLQNAESALNRILAMGLVEVGDVASIMDQLRAANVAPNIKAMFERIAHPEVPDGFVPSFHFVLHEGCGAPLPHGYIKGEVEQSNIVHTLLEGLDVINYSVNEGPNPLHILDGVSLLKEMVVANLPVNEDDATVQYDGLPSEVREKAERERADRDGRVELVDIPGLGRVVSLRFSLRHDPSQSV